MRRKKEVVYYGQTEVATISKQGASRATQCSNLCLGLAEEKVCLKYRHWSLWNVTTWRLRLDFFSWLVTIQTQGSGPCKILKSQTVTKTRQAWHCWQEFNSVSSWSLLCCGFACLRACSIFSKLHYRLDKLELSCFLIDLWRRLSPFKTFRRTN